MIGWTWWYPCLAVVAAVVGVWFVVRGATGGPAGRVACWTHGLMALAMAGMFWPRFDPVPTLAGTALFAVLGAWFAAVRLRQGAGATDEPTHLAVGCAAMVVMYLGMATGGSGTGHAGHAGHAAGTGQGSVGLLAVAVGLVLTGYFAWHAWHVSSGSTTPHGSPSDGRLATATRRRVDTATVAHVTLDVLMAVMFLGML